MNLKNWWHRSRYPIQDHGPNARPNFGNGSLPWNGHGSARFWTAPVLWRFCALQHYPKRQRPVARMRGLQLRKFGRIMSIVASGKSSRRRWRKSVGRCQGCDVMLKSHGCHCFCFTRTENVRLPSPLNFRWRKNLLARVHRRATARKPKAFATRRQDLVFIPHAAPCSSHVVLDLPPAGCSAASANISTFVGLGR